MKKYLVHYRQIHEGRCYVEAKNKKSINMDTVYESKDFQPEADVVKRIYITDAKEVDVLKCEGCGKYKNDVEMRNNNYAQDVGGETDAMWEACDDCDYANTMDI